MRQWAESAWLLEPCMRIQAAKLSWEQSHGGYQQTGPGYFDNTCRRCGAEGHFVRDCTKPDTHGRGGYNRGNNFRGTQSYYPTNPPRRFNPTCWHCGQSGHYANQCNNPPVSQQNGPPSGSGSRNGSVENRCGFCHQTNTHLSIDCPNKPSPRDQLSTSVRPSISTGTPATQEFRVFAKSRSGARYGAWSDP